MERVKLVTVLAAGGPKFTSPAHTWREKNVLPAYNLALVIRYEQTVGSLGLLVSLGKTQKATSRERFILKGVKWREIEQDIPCLPVTPTDRYTSM